MNTVSMVSEKRSEQRFDNVIALVLRTGVLLAALFVVTGGVLYLAGEHGTVPDYRVFHSEPAELRSVGDTVHEALQLHGTGLIQFGLLVLIATPIARVVLSVVVFLLERDWIYVGVTLLVLTLLVYSLLGRHG